MKVPGELEALAFDVVLSWADATASGDLLRSMRARGLRQPVLAGDAVVSPVFLACAGGGPGQVLAPRPCAHREKGGGAASLHDTSGGRQAAAAQSSPAFRAVYEATGHLLDALDRSGADRMELRRVLEERNELELVRLEGGRWR